MTMPAVSTWWLKRIFVALVTLTFGLFTLTFLRNRLTTRPLAVYQTPVSHNPSQHAAGGGGPLFGLFNAFSSGHKQDPDAAFGVNNTQFHAVLRQRASERGIIFLSSTDSGYLDLAFNLYYTSFKKLNINNYLFVGSDSTVCDHMKQNDIACFEYIHDKDAGTSSSYFSLAFKRKTHLKTKIILEALKLGLKVIIVDVDIVFLQDPTPLMNCADCDIEITSDEVEGNSGFYMARPTTGCIQLHAEAWRKGLERPEISNQKAVDRTMESMHARGLIKVRNLDPEIFANGVVFFEKGHRMFRGDNPSIKGAIVHNNWIVSSEAKILRFKEYGIWDSDIGGYYSDPKRKYLIFGVPIDFGGHDTPKQELRSLRTALVLGDLLNRTVILPQMHCYGCTYHGLCDHKGQRCMFSTFYRVDNFEKTFKNKYRESVFLSHPLIPKSVLDSKSSAFLIASDVSENLIPNLPKSVKVVVPQNIGSGATVPELERWFSNDTSSILVFHSLYNGVDLTANYTATHPVIYGLKDAFKTTSYRQL